MITLEPNQTVMVDTAFAVKVGGDYAPDALVDVYRLTDPDQTCQFYALTIATGEYPQ